MSTGAVDLKLNADGDLDISTKRRDLQWVSGGDAIAQLAACRLRLLRGEWLTDTGAGLDFDRVIGVGVTDAGIEAEVRRVLDNVPGITQVLSVDVTRSGRAATVQWRALASTDELTGSLEVE